MKLKLTASTIWNVAPSDEKMARDIMEKKPIDAIVDSIVDAINGDAELEDVKVEVEELK